MQEFIGKGLTAVEAMLGGFEQAPLCSGDRPELADLCLILNSTMLITGAWRLTECRGYAESGVLVIVCLPLTRRTRTGRYEVPFSP